MFSLLWTMLSCFSFNTSGICKSCACALMGRLCTNCAPSRRSRCCNQVPPGDTTSLTSSISNSTQDLSVTTASISSKASVPDACAVQSISADTCPSCNINFDRTLITNSSKPTPNIASIIRMEPTTWQCNASTNIFPLPPHKHSPVPNFTWGSAARIRFHAGGRSSIL